MEKQTMGDFIASLRKSKGITQKELAELLNVSDKAVSRWECGKTVPDVYLLPLIADIFDITVDELIRGARNENRQSTDSQEKYIKMREAMMENKYASYKTKAVFPITITVVGIIICFICSSYYARLELGVGISVVLFVISVACQIFFLLNIKKSIAASELDREALDAYKYKTYNFSVYVFISLICLEALILSDSYDLFWWCGPAASVTAFLLCAFVRSIIIKATNLPVPDRNKMRSRIFFKVFLCFACVVGVLAASMLCINSCRKWIEKPEVFYITDSTKEIEDFLEKQLGERIKTEISDDGISFSDSDSFDNYVVEYRAEPLEKDGEKCICVKLYTVETYTKAGVIIDRIIIAYIVLFFVSAVTAALVYVKKRKNREMK